MKIKEWLRRRLRPTDDEVMEATRWLADWVADYGCLPRRLSRREIKGLRLHSERARLRTAYTIFCGVAAGVSRKRLSFDWFLAATDTPQQAGDLDYDVNSRRDP